MKEKEEKEQENERNIKEKENKKQRIEQEEEERKTKQATHEKQTHPKANPAVPTEPPMRPIASLINYNLKELESP